jgi:phage host-nuclease inhibitor protein Gam
MQSLLPKDDEPIKPTPQAQPQPQPAPGYQSYQPPNYPPPNYPPPNYPPVTYAPQPAPVNYAAQPPAPSSGSANLKTSILMGAVLALIAACGYLFYQLNDVRTQIAKTNELLNDEITKINETSSVSVQTSRRNIDSLTKDVQKYRQQAAQLSGEAKAEATKHADELAAKLERAQIEESKKVAAVTADVSAVKDVAAATSAKVGEVTNDVGTLKTDTASNKSAIEKTIADLKSAKGDLGVQSGLIATNGKELLALKQLGERNYIDIKLAKVKKNVPQKFGDIQLVLESAEPKKNTFSLVIIADDKKVEKKNRTVNEPIQFLLSKSVQPYELVINDVKKDLITGYLSVPKVMVTRGGSN